MTLTGVIAAVPTPVDANLRPLSQPFIAHCQSLLAGGCDGLNILGSTGEATSFDIATRREVMAFAAEALPRERLMVGTGGPSLAESIALTEYADDLGYGIALVLPPFYYKPLSEDGLFAWYAAIDAALGPRRIRVWFYNYPQMTGLQIPPTVIARLNALNPARFSGIKDSSGDLGYCDAVHAAAPDVAIFPSSETSLAEGRQRGYSGCVSATANLSAALCQRLWQGDKGVAEAVGQIRARVTANPLIPAIKAVLAGIYGETLWTRVLPPFLAMDPDQAAALLAEIQTLRSQT